MKNLIAHRGLKDKNIKESSYEAFLKAFNNPYYVGIECDIRTTKDNVLVINHNAFCKTKLIREYTYKELKKEYNLVTLKELLEIKTDKIFLIEIKEPNLNIDIFLKLLNKYSYQKIYIMSFYRKIIKKLNIPNHFYKLGVLNYVLNSEKNYEDYDFICLLERVYTDKLYKYFHNQNILVFLYGIHQDKTYEINNEVYFITDKIITANTLQNNKTLL